MDIQVTLGSNPLIAPLLALVGWTAIMWVWLYIARIGQMKAKRIDAESLQSKKGKEQLDGPTNWPAENYNHLFEIPVLFYVVCLLMIAVGKADDLAAGLAWGFVVLRVMHSIVHCTYNRIMHRFALFAISSLVLFALIGRVAWLTL